MVAFFLSDFFAAFFFVCFFATFFLAALAGFFLGFAFAFFLVLFFLGVAFFATFFFFGFSPPKMLSQLSENFWVEPTLTTLMTDPENRLLGLFGLFQKADILIVDEQFVNMPVGIGKECRVLPPGHFAGVLHELCSLLQQLSKMRF